MKGLGYPLLALANVIAGAFLIAAVFGFSDTTATDLGFAVSIVVAIFGAAMAYAGYEEGEALGTAALGIATAALALWTVIATQVFEPSTAVWLVLGSAIGHVALSITGLIGHEVTRNEQAAAVPTRARSRPKPRSRAGSRTRARSGTRTRSSR